MQLNWYGLRGKGETRLEIFKLVWVTASSGVKLDPSRNVGQHSSALSYKKRFQAEKKNLSPAFIIRWCNSKKPVAGSYLAQLNATNGNLDGWIFLWTTSIRLRPAQVLEICHVQSWSCKWGCLRTQSKEGHYKRADASGLTDNSHPDLYTHRGLHQLLLPSSVSDQKPEA